MLKRFIKKNY